MNLKNFGKMCVTVANRTLFHAKKHSPELCLIAAGVTGIACVVKACKATHKSEPVFEHHKEQIAEAEEYLEVNPDNFTDDEKRRYIRHIYINTGIKLVKNYATAVGLGLLTAGLVFTGYHILYGRNLALVSALAAEQAKNAKLLEERELKKLPEGDEENTELTKKKDTAKSLKPDETQFKFFFGEGNKWWQDVKVYGPRANPFALQMKEEMFNKLLPTKQVIFVNEILDHFGLPKVYEGQYAGWVYDPKKGEHQIDFGLHSGYEPTELWMNGEDPTASCLVCLNADSYIMDRALPRLGDMHEFYARGGK